MHHIYYRKSLAFCEVSFLWFCQIHQWDFFGESTKYTNYIWGPYFCFKANLHKIEDFGNRKWFTASLFWKCIFSISLINKSNGTFKFYVDLLFQIPDHGKSEPGLVKSSIPRFCDEIRYETPAYTKYFKLVFSNRTFRVHKVLWNLQHVVCIYLQITCTSVTYFQSFSGFGLIQVFLPYFFFTYTLSFSQIL